MGQQANLAGAVTDDGLPNPPNALTFTWSKASGPGSVTFNNASVLQTAAHFTQVGSYVLRLSVSDSALTTNDTLAVTVNEQGGSDPGDNNTGGNPGGASVTAKKGAFHPMNGDIVELLCGSAKIIDRRGNLVRDLPSTGGPLTWDGRNSDGQFVASGVYTGVCTGNTAQKNSFKLVVIK
jgi:hypothetical protein